MIMNGWQIIDSMVVLKKPTLLDKDISIAPVTNSRGIFYPYSKTFPIDPKTPVFCYFSALRKSHNPTNIVLVCVLNDHSLHSHPKTYDEFATITKNIIDTYSKSLELKDSYKIKIKFIYQSGEHNNKYDLMKTFGLTERDSRDNFSFAFYCYKNKSDSPISEQNPLAIDKSKCNADNGFLIIDGEYYFDH